MNNPIRKMKTFTTDPNCPKDQQKRVVRNGNIFFVSLLIVITMTGIMIPALILGTETTLVFTNRDNIAGIGVGKILVGSELPSQPFYVYDANGSVYNITSTNVTNGFVETIGFIIIDEDLLNIIAQKPQLYTELIGFAMLKLAPMLKNGNVNDLNNITHLAIYKYLQQYPIILVIGNFEDTITHDIVFKIQTGKYFIPLFEVCFQNILTGQRFYNVGGWIDFSNLNELETQRGVWDITINSVSYDYATSYNFATDQLQNIRGKR